MFQIGVPVSSSWLWPMPSTPCISWEEAVNSWGIRSLLHVWETWVEFLNPGLSQISLNCCGHLGVKQWVGDFFVSLSLYLCFPASEIKMQSLQK